MRKMKLEFLNQGQVEIGIGEMSQGGRQQVFLLRSDHEWGHNRHYTVRTSRGLRSQTPAVNELNLDTFGRTLTLIQEALNQDQPVSVTVTIGDSVPRIFGRD